VTDRNAPTLARRQLGRGLTELRKRAGKTQEDVSAASIAGRTKIWNLEKGRSRSRVRPGDVRELCLLYGASSEETERLVALAYASQQDSYWEEFGGSVPNWLGMYADLEAAASRMVAWSPDVVAGIVQTERYMRALMAGDPRWSPPEVEKLVRFRLERQKRVLGRERPTDLTVIQGPGSLILQVGGPDVLAEQIDHLRHLHTSGQVSVFVLPPSAGAYPMHGAFALLEFDDVEDPAFVYAEFPLGAHYLEKPPEVTELRWVLGQIQNKCQPISFEE
jgi:hypothetical protein